jgi:alkanesulfonate monooxygenase SsuD/methylene tetrahydromethanopterin reductase-like flavin-dependent oxidoreductase (luciferase family)
MASMKLGVHLPTAGRGASPDGIARVAEEAERIGLDSVWSWDRLMRPTVPIAMGGPGGPVMDAPEDFATVYDPIETLTYVAARTSRITLGTTVLDALFQSPVILARRLATLDRFSGGRLIAGIGQGWMEQEFQAAGVSMKRRGAGFEEHLQAMRAVWGPDPVSFAGRFYRIPEADIGPKPAHPDGPRVVLGAGSPQALRRVGRLGAGLTLVIFDWDMVRPGRASRDAAGQRQRHRGPGGRGGTAAGLTRPGRGRPREGREAGRRARLLALRRRPAPRSPAPGPPPASVARGRNDPQDVRP